MPTTTTTCPCGSLQNYDLCCRRYHTGQVPRCANELMRARYSAFYFSLSDYLTATHHPSTLALGSYDQLAQEQTQSDTHWQALRLLDIQQGGEHDTQGIVEFAAYYRHGQQHDVLRERSHFVYEKNQWWYHSGVFIDASEPVRSRIGRNLTCWCGSGKKYKRCHALTVCAPNEPSSKVGLNQSGQ